MKSIVALTLLALAASWALLPLAMGIYRRLGKLDHPDAKRKLHAQPIPRAGGVAIFTAYALALGVLQILPAGGNVVLDRYSVFLTRLLPAAGVIFLTGLLDDWFDLRPRYKILGQSLGAALAYWAGIRILPMPEPLEWLSFGLTVFWLILSSNAFNLVDGSDGLAGSLGVLSGTGLVILAIVLDYTALALMFAPLVGAILPFLRKNWPPASVFMGDSGSLTIGFLIGCGGAALSRRYPDGTGLLAAVLLLALPLAEVALSAARRTLRGRSIFEADCHHLHHELRRKGMDSSQLLLHMSLFAALAVAMASSLFVLGLAERVLLIGALAALFLREVGELAYAEFIVLGRALWGGGLRAWLRQQIELHTLEKEIEAAATLEDLWRCLRNSAHALGLKELYMQVGERHWEENLLSGGAERGWQVRIDLPYGGWLNFSVNNYGGGRLENASSDFAAAVKRGLNAQRLAGLMPVPVALAFEPREVLLWDRSA